MRIRMKVHMIGPGENWKPGMERDTNDAEAVRLINAGYAERVQPSASGGRTQPKSKTEYRRRKS